MAGRTSKVLLAFLFSLIGMRGSEYSMLPVSESPCLVSGITTRRMKARIKAESDFLVVVRPAGVYCPWCQSQILTADRAKLIGITEEER